MNRDEMMLMAREAGFTFFYSAEEECMRVVPRAYAEVYLERFANRVAEKEREKEREACALICDKYERHSDSPMNFAYNCAEAIRARSGG